jgi:flagellar hook-basal body complex protein FliE
MINFNPNITSIQPKTNQGFAGIGKPNNTDAKKPDFADAIKTVEKYLSKADDMQQSTNTLITELLAGKNDDVNSVVSAMAKADISFKLLVGVRNKLIEAYKETLRMPL